MRNICVYSFLMKCNPNHVEQHSDSSDFESPEKKPIITSKSGNHRLLNTRYSNIDHKKQSNELNMQHNDVNNYKGKNNPIIYRNSPYKNDVKTHESNLNYNNENAKKFITNRSTGDEFCLYPEKDNTRSVLRDKVIPCVSTIFRRPKNKHMNGIKEGKADILNNSNRKDYTNCERRRINKLHKQHRGYSVQPVYTVEEDVQTSPFQVKNESSNNHKLNNYSEENNFNVSQSKSIESDTESIKKYKYRKFLQTVKKKLDTEIRKEYHEYPWDGQELYPSKLQLKLPYQVFASSSCLAKCASTNTEDLAKVPSNSSAIWSFFAQKLKSKFQKQEFCDCIDPSIDRSKSCSPEDCEYLMSPNTPDIVKRTNANTSPRQTSESSSECSTCSKKKINIEPSISCKCQPKNKKKVKDKVLTCDDESKPCQKNHDSITKEVSKKYKGEILCIHNPPCVLINGCLNLPPPKSYVQGNLWPVTENKKSSFVQKCKKMKKSKQKDDNSSQYHPPYADLEQCLPEFRSEKIIQSICNHSPPCEIVYGCQKAKYDPNLQNSCIHVPMCRKLPECVFLDKNDHSSLCPHDPKCAELPLCSRKFVVLTAKDERGIQVKPKLKMACRHEPHCFMIPKCLALAITGDYLPCGAIPGCVHNPKCENIPACCRKSLKQMVSVPSQYPNACRIV